ncbi:hypothetical protein COCOR_05148 [Corallococcus coralloides DSM 2259]|uniref:Lipoprotein n=1 Tax=Corallococcus coralloides (strain ATCC 25202 / DSM 2259 / NBRC 100086 / M2) TaxID=1144275 RepID=H8MSQ1_CORCM|nr:DUF3472 domain-containing protein [Corallococcus coralloides]AFE06217.1 hypothetical protein COCOR_05148 [Corallococcus coralloides DSM 2259]
MTRFLQVLTPFCLGSLLACGGTDPQATQPEPRTLATTSQSLVKVNQTYSYWDVQNVPAQGLYNFDLTIFPSNDPAADATHVAPWYFYAAQFAFKTGGDAGYIGIQTDPNGKRAVFSIWGANGATCSNVSGAICQPFSHEGVGYQTMVPFNWVAGQYYRVRVWQNGADAEGEWWLGVIINDSTQTETVVGRIRVPWGRNWLSGSIINWVEWYGPGTDNCTQLTSSTVYFAPPKGNAGTLTAPPPYNTTGQGPCASDVSVYGEWMRHYNGW